MNPEEQPIILQIAQIIQAKVHTKMGLLVLEVALRVRLGHRDLQGQEAVDLQVQVDQVQVEDQVRQEDSH